MSPRFPAGWASKNVVGEGEPGKVGVSQRVGKCEKTRVPLSGGVRYVGTGNGEPGTEARRGFCSLFSVPAVRVAVSDRRPYHPGHATPGTCPRNRRVISRDDHRVL